MKEKYKLENVAIRLTKMPPLYSDEQIGSPKDAIKILGKELEYYDREVVCVVNLRGDNRPVNLNVVSMGTADSAIAEARDVFKSAILSNAPRIMLIHNHPSGNLKPSSADLKLTERIFAAGELMGIPLLDHVILGKQGEYYSFLEQGLIPDRGQAEEKVAEKKESIMDAIRQHSKKQARGAEE